MDQLDLKLWADQNLIRRQNQLKSRFWTLFGDLGDHFAKPLLSQIHPAQKGKKLSKGNDLLGFPYHVLDLIRDFNEESGLNIRVLNWFGHGVFLIIYLSTHYQEKTKENWTDSQFKLSLCENIFDYPGMILEKKNEIFEENKIAVSNGFLVLFKELSINADEKSTLSNLKSEIEKVINILK